MEFDIFGIKKSKRDIMGLQTGLEDLRDKLSEANEQIENLTENLKSLERINLYGRGDEPAVIVDYISKKNMSYVNEMVLRLYIDGEEYTIHDIGNCFRWQRDMILRKSIMVDGNIATVVIQTNMACEHIYHIEYDKGCYVHQVREIKKEEVTENE